MVEIHAMWILLMVTAGYLVGMVVGWRFTVEEPKEDDPPMAIRKDYADEDVYGDIPSWLKRQAD